MKKNIKTTGLIALFVGCLLMTSVIPAMAVTPPWMLARQDDMGSGGGDPRIQPYVYCCLPKATVSEFDIRCYYITCDPCNQYVFDTPAVQSTCVLKD